MTNLSKAVCFPAENKKQIIKRILKTTGFFRRDAELGEKRSKCFGGQDHREVYITDLILK